jgi:uroporphyrinogen decarboxylase
MRQAGRYLPEYRSLRATAGSFLDLCYTPEFATEVTLQPLRRYAFDAAILFSDILVVPDALGRSVVFRTGEGPALTPLQPDDVDGLRSDGIRHVLAPVLRTVARLREAMPEDLGHDRTALIGFCGAPWTVSTYMIEGGGSKDYATTKEWAYGRPEVYGRLIDILVEASADYLIAQVDAGAEALQIFDSWAGVLPEAAFRRWVIEPIRRLVDRVKAVHPEVPIIGFPRGAGMLYEAFARESGCDAVGLDTTVPLRWAAEVVQPLKPVQGNLDPIHLVVGGPALDEAVDAILDILADGPFIFNLGHGIVPQTPPDNVTRLVDRIRSRTG